MPRNTFLLILACATCLHASPYALAPGADTRASYLIVAADDFAEACDELLAFRESQGYTVGIVSLSDACGPDGASPQNLADFLSDARERWGTRFVLLVGDALGDAGRTVPMKTEPSAYYSVDFLSERTVATDYAYAALGKQTPQLHVGRFPADSPEELQTMIHRTIRYETSLTPGPWQRRVDFVAGQAGFGPLVDAVIEAQFTQIVSGDIPPAYEVHILHGRLQSPYCPPPTRFSDTAVDLLREGSLFFVYVGHGVCSGFDDLRWEGGKAPLMAGPDLRALVVRSGLPVMVAIACDTARIDDPHQDSIAEAMLKLPAGPVAYIGSTRICQPYGNALLGKALVQASLGGGNATLGEVLDAARTAVLQPEVSPFRAQADGMAGALQGAQNLPAIRADTVRHYILLGDPATRLRRPGRMELSVERTEAGPIVTGTCGIGSGRVTVTLERARDKLPPGLNEMPDPKAPDFAERMTKRCAEANQTTLAQVETELIDGAFRAEFPAPIPEGVALVRAFAWNEQASAAGATALVP